jgi:LmbE family N-acetylglucosaminyl deacetylase
MKAKVMLNEQLKYNVLIIVAHADDETLGCAGTIAKHIAEGDHVSLVFMTNGVSSRDDCGQQQELGRNSAMDNAMQMLGVKHYQCFDFPDNQMDSVPLLSIVKSIETVIDELKPNIIYSHFAHDLNIDHQITHQAVMTACRPIKGSSVKEIYSFEVLSSTEWQSKSHSSFQGQYIVDITPYWHKKKQALLCYQEELRDFPHSRSLVCIEALAILRGASHGFEKAEAFQVERILKG